jgi:ankyrin repeat protein
LHLAINCVHDWYDDGESEYLGVVRLLLRYGSDNHARDNEGRTPFMRATEKGYYEFLQVLLEHGAEDHRVSVTRMTWTDKS